LDSTHRDQQLLLLLLLLPDLLPQGPLSLLHLLQGAHLRLLEVQRLLLVARPQPTQLLLISLVLLAQSLGRQEVLTMDTPLEEVLTMDTPLEVLTMDTPLEVLTMDTPAALPCR